MAGPLASVERFFERLFERPAARLFQTKLEPVHLQRGIERAMESERRIVARRAYAPHAFRILVHSDDLVALDGDRAVLTRDLAEHVRGYARGHSYTLVARPAVEIDSSTAVSPGDVKVYAQPFAVVAAPERALRPRPEPPAAPAATNGHAETDAHLLGQVTAAYTAHSMSTPRAQLAVRAPGLAVERLPVRPGTVRLGRSLDNDVVLVDDRVSRHHGQIGVRLGMLVYTDLGSTNGSFLNGRHVTEIALGPGDVLQLGRSTVTIEPAT